MTSIADLDQLAGFDRLPIHRLQVAWRGLENAGKYVRLEATLEAVGQGALPPSAWASCRSSWRRPIHPGTLYFIRYPISGASRRSAAARFPRHARCGAGRRQRRRDPGDTGRRQWAAEHLRGLAFTSPLCPGWASRCGSRRMGAGWRSTASTGPGCSRSKAPAAPPEHEQRYTAWSADSRSLAFFRASDPGQLYTQAAPDGPRWRWRGLTAG